VDMSKLILSVCWETSMMETSVFWIAGRKLVLWSCPVPHRSSPSVPFRSRCAPFRLISAPFRLFSPVPPFSTRSALFPPHFAFFRTVLPYFRPVPPFFAPFRPFPPRSARYVFFPFFYLHFSPSNARRDFS
jgi:hypothetical protein